MPVSKQDNIRALIKRTALERIRAAKLKLAHSRKANPKPPVQNGPFLVKDRFGRIVRKEHYKDGKLEGVIEQYDRNGNAARKFTYKQGAKHGPALYYDKKGQVTRRVYFANNIMHGECEYYKHGKLSAQVNFVQGKQTGIAKFYDRVGNLRTEGQFENGKKHGLLTTYDDLGKPSSVTPYQHNEKHGNAKHFYPSGALQKIEPYVRDKLEGNVQTFAPHGVMLLQVTYKNGKPVGKPIRYDNHGDDSSESTSTEAPKELQATSTKPVKKRYHTRGQAKKKASSTQKDASSRDDSNLSQHVSRVSLDDSKKKEETEVNEEASSGFMGALYSCTVGQLVNAANSLGRKTYRGYANSLTAMGFTGAEPDKFVKLTLAGLVVAVEYENRQQMPWQDLIGLKIQNKTGRQGSRDFYDGWLMVYDISFGYADLESMGPEKGLQISKWNEQQTDELPYAFFQKVLAYPDAAQLEFTLGTPEYNKLNGTRTSALYELISNKGQGTQFIHLWCVRFDSSDKGPDVEKLRTEALKHRPAYRGTSSSTEATVDDV